MASTTEPSATISPAEHDLRKRILGGFHHNDPDNTGTVHSSVFQGVLDALGLRFGQAAVDQVMLECRIDDRGVIDYRLFEDSVARADAAMVPSAAAASHGAPPPAARTGGTPGSARVPPSPAQSLLSPGGARTGSIAEGADFRAAVMHHMGSSAAARVAGGGPVSVPDEVLRLPQPQRVRRLARELNGLFHEWDSGAVSVDVFRERLRRLGIDETVEARRLLQSPGPITFSELFRALCADVTATPEHAAGATSVSMRSGGGGGGGGVSTARGGRGDAASLASSLLHEPDALRRRLTGSRRLGPRSGEGGRDVITWRQTEPGGGPSAHGIGIGNTGLDYDIDTHRNLTGKARETNPEAEETGASGLIYGGHAAVDAAALRDLDRDMRRTHVAGDSQGLPRGVGVARALQDSVNVVPPSARFESAAENAARQGLGAAGAPPRTSAGYFSADGGFLREQVYSCVRQLDAGTLTSSGFRDRLLALGIAPPPAVARLLADFECNGSVDFARFVRSFDEYFASRAQHDPDAEATAARKLAPRLQRQPGERVIDDAVDADHTGAPSTARTSRKHTNPSATGHGDIISWDGVDISATEEAKMQRSLGLRPGMTRRRDIFDARSPGMGVIAQADAQRAMEQPEMFRRSRRAPGPAGIADRTAGNFLMWGGGMYDPGADADAAGVAAHAADILPDGTRVGARARVMSPGREDTPSTPFGTERDVQPMRSPAEARAALERARAAQSPTLRMSAPWMHTEG